MTTIQVRRGTAAQWASAATVLAAGELGLDTTNNILKLGDGSTAWASLNPVLNNTFAPIPASATAPSSPATGQMWWPLKSHRPVIWDTDFYTDVDDAVAGRILAYHDRIGDIEIQAVIQSVAAPRAPEALDAFLRSEGIVTSIGQVTSTYSDLLTPGPYHGNLVALPHADFGSPTDSTTLYRTVLAASTGKVDIISTGFLGALQGLLASSGDGISALTGLQLVTAKVNRWWCMGGAWPTGAENNFNRTTLAKAASTYVVTNWPSTVPVTFLGNEVGTSILSGDNLLAGAPSSDALAKAMVDHGTVSAVSGRASWDPLLVRLACVGSTTTAGYTTVQGTAAVDSNGANTWTNDAAGPHQYVVKSWSDAAFKADLNSLLIPGSQPATYVGMQRWDGVAWKAVDPAGRRLPYSNPVLLSSRPGPRGLIDAWLADNVTVSDGTTVSTWPSSRVDGYGLALVQGTSAVRPTYRASIGSKKCVEFTSGKYLRSNGSIPFPRDASFTAYAKVRWATLPTSNQTVIAMDEGSNFIRDWHLKGITGSIAQAANFVKSATVGGAATGASDNSAASLVVNTWHLLTIRVDDINGLECMIDASGNGASAPRFGLNAASIPMNVGCSVSNGAALSEPFVGYLAEARIYAGRHSDAEVTTIAAQM